MKKLVFFLALLLIVPYANAGMVVGSGLAVVTSSPPSYSAEIQRFGETSSASTTVLTVASAISAGQTIVIISTGAAANETVSGIVDSGSNTYGLLKSQAIGGDGEYITIYSAYATTGLTTSNTITLTWANPSYSYRWGAVFVVDDAASSGQPDQSCGKTAYTGGAVTCSANTTETNTAIIGTVYTFSATYGSMASGYNLIGSVHNYNGKGYYFYKDASASGAQDPGGTLSVAANYTVIWAALK